MRIDMTELPAAPISPETAPFWSAATERRLALPRCKACGKMHYYPRAHCPFCAGEAFDWIDAAGGGEIYAFSVLEKAQPPYVLAYVRLDEGPTMLTNIVDCSADDLNIGGRVQIVFAAMKGGGRAPVFTPEDRGR